MSEVSSAGARDCPRCGFRVIVTNPHLAEVFEEHAVDCPRRPSSTFRKTMKRKIESARFLYGEGRAREVAEDLLAQLQ